MKRSWLRTLAWAAILWGLSTGVLQAATTWQVQSETFAQAYRFLDAERAPVARTRFGQVLRVASRTLLASGGLVTGRVLLRFQGEPEVTAAEQSLLYATRATRFDVLGASVTGVGLLGGAFDFEIGRFLRLDSLGFAMIDGAAVDMRTPWHFGVGIHGGLEPSETRDTLTWNPFRLDGFLEEDGEPVVAMVGASVFATDVGLNSLRLDFRQWQDTAGALRARQVAASGSLAFPRLVVLGIDARYDLIGDVLADARAWLRVPVSDWIHLEGRYQRVVPVFDTQSIWSVFPLYPLQEAQAGATFRIEPWNLAITARGGARVLENARGAEVEPGLHLGAVWRSERRELRASWDRFRGVTGAWDLVWAEASSPLLVPELVGRLSLTYARVDDAISAGLRDDVFGGSLSVDYTFTPGWQIRAFVEDQEGRLEKHGVRGFLILQASLGTEGVR